MAAKKSAPVVEVSATEIAAAVAAAPSFTPAEALATIIAKHEEAQEAIRVYNDAIATIKANLDASNVAYSDEVITEARNKVKEYINGLSLPAKFKKMMQELIDIDGYSFGNSEKVDYPADLLEKIGYVAPSDVVLTPLHDSIIDYVLKADEEGDLFDDDFKSGLKGLFYVKPATVKKAKPAGTNATGSTSNKYSDAAGMTIAVKDKEVKLSGTAGNYHAHGRAKNTLGTLLNLDKAGVDKWVNKNYNNK